MRPHTDIITTHIQFLKNTIFILIPKIPFLVPIIFIMKLRMHHGLPYGPSAHPGSLRHITGNVRA